jgi:glucuronate isomerase
MASNTFLHENFLLQTKTAANLYHDYAKEMPIIDYHNHLPPQQIYENHLALAGACLNYAYVILVY